MTTTTILFGPQGCGKSLAAAGIAQRLGLTAVVDEWMPGQPLRPGALHVTHASREELPTRPGVRRIDFGRMQA